MSEHIVKSFSDDLEAISASVAQMGGLAESMLADALEAVGRRDTTLAEKTIRADARVDKLERQVEDQVVKLIALRQPMGVDLREAISALKVSSDLERIGDLAKNIAKRAIAISREQPARLTQGLARMGRQALGQLKGVLDAYAARDPEAALSVWRRDEEIDDLYNSLFRELLTYMMEDPRTIGTATHFLFIAKNLERIGDHATNVAENIHFMVKGIYIEDERPKSDMTSTATGPQASQ